VRRAASSSLDQTVRRVGSINKPETYIWNLSTLLLGIRPFQFGRTEVGPAIANVFQSLSGQACIQPFPGIKFVFRQLFDIKQRGVRAASCADQFIQFQLHRFTVSVLSILNDEHHQERNNRRRCINEKLPRIAEVEKRTRYEPYNDQDDNQSERSRPAGPARANPGESLETADLFSRL